MKPPPADRPSRLLAVVEAADEEPWLPGLTADLVRCGSTKMLAPRGLSLESYTTTEFLTGLAPEMVLRAGPVAIEILTGSVRRRFEVLGLSFVDALEEATTTVISNAYGVLRSVPSLGQSVALLVRSIHVLSAPTEDHDISHSDPEIPFSIFLSVCEPEVANATLRVAESIVHEAMHLQLSLIEALSPIVVDTSERLRSPWRDEDRPTAGVLHGFYVFSALQRYYALSEDNCSHPSYVARRRDQIQNELEQAAASLEQASLTEVGAHLYRMCRLATRT